mmetsp:Transcript_24561/g.30180  ORF Transcript_24561/g.30180 Transcript_24561/m.30180 type:complete len:291 (+) Transcript_24561:34-906(+)
MLLLLPSSRRLMLRIVSSPAASHYPLHNSSVVVNFSITNLATIRIQHSNCCTSAQTASSIIAIRKRPYTAAGTFYTQQQQQRTLHGPQSPSLLINPQQQLNQPWLISPMSRNEPLLLHAYRSTSLRRFSTNDGEQSSDTEKCDSKTATPSPLTDISSDDLNLVLSELDDNDNDTPAPSDKSGFSDIPGAQHGGKKLAILFTCKICETRSAKQFTERAYKHGVVMCRCPKCENLHLIADRLGFFEDGSWDIESVMKDKLESGGGDANFKVINDDNVLELTLRDVVGGRSEK